MQENQATSAAALRARTMSFNVTPVPCTVMTGPPGQVIVPNTEVEKYRGQGYKPVRAHVPAGERIELQASPSFADDTESVPEPVLFDTFDDAAPAVLLAYAREAKLADASSLSADEIRAKLREIGFTPGVKG